jgi:glycerophosphoryl diester phosphodiesterase
MSNQPVIIAHRGNAHQVIENTMEAFSSAFMLPQVGVECDLHLSADQKVVIHHDNTTARMCGTSYTLCQTPLATLTALHCRDKRWPKKRAPIPTLSELLANTPGQRYLLLECKSTEVVLPALELVSRSNQDPQYIVWISFLPRALDLLRPYYTWAAQRFLLVDPATHSLVHAIATAHNGCYTGLNIGYHDDTFHQHAALIRAANLQLGVWTVDSFSALASSFTESPRFITTNDPETACRVKYKIYN